MQIVAKIDRWLRAMPHTGIWILALSLVGVLYPIDLLTGYEIAFSHFYLIPIGIAAWYGSRVAGLVVSLLSAISWYAADVGAGSADFYSHPWIPVWNSCVRLSFFLIVTLLLTAFQEALRREHALARTDYLTGLMTRRAFEERLVYDIALSARQGTPLSLAFIDLDRFKSVNDTQGHAAGDRLLRLVGQTLTSNNRRVDALARLGGDEFALILPDTDLEEARIVTHKLQTALREALRNSGHPVTASIGVITWVGGDTTVDVLLDHADHLMYQAKATRDAAAFQQIPSPLD